MLQSNLIGETKKEWPNEATLKSHGLLIKGGYIKQMASGIFTMLPLGTKVSKKIENIIREEMESVGAQEIIMPVVATRKLWDMTGRYEAIGSELLRFKDRTGSEMVLSMTHEEAAVFSTLADGKSYQKYPFSIYQLQTKFRDEARSRGGLIRVREFTMKDAYSFHTSYEDLDKVYNKYYDAYNRIYKRVGIPEVIAVASDTGMMGGTGAHEYMILCDAGEDKIVTCSSCDYSANMEVAVNAGIDISTTEIKELDKTSTPGIKTIEDLIKYLKIPSSNMGKAVIYYRIDTDETVVVFIRADREVNETKLKNYLKVAGELLVPKTAEDNDGICYGFVGPKGLKTDKVVVVYDESLRNEKALVVGSNEVDFHYTGFNIEREIGKVEYIDVGRIVENDKCSKCVKSNLKISNGIEVGHIFKLGDKYTKAMGMTYLDENGKSNFPVMGCYGIGVGRLLASVLEAKATDKQVNWPASIAPFDVHICPIGYGKDNIATKVADSIYVELKNNGLDVLLDDRDKSAGIKFADADLVGAPIRVIIGARNLENDNIEIKVIGNEQSELVNKDKVIEYVKNIRKGWIF